MLGELYWMCTEVLNADAPSPASDGILTKFVGSDGAIVSVGRLVIGRQWACL